MRVPISRPTLCLALLSALVAGGCKDAKVSIYDAPKESFVPSSQAPTSLPDAPSSDLAWTKPAPWQELPPTSFRKGNYLAQDPEADAVEITVSSFPGSVGDMLGNVNRWLNQIALPPIDAAQLDALAAQRSVAGLNLSVVDLKSEAPRADAQRIIAGVAPHAGQTWFFKMTGPHEAVEKQIAAFDQLLASIRPVAPAPVSSAPSASPTKKHVDHLNFEAPPDWEKSEGSSLRIASYQIAKPGYEPADFSITSFPGDTGGIVANVNRWRAQIGLEPWSAEEVQQKAMNVQANELNFQVFDLRPNIEPGQQNNTQRILVAILFHHGSTWFFKLRGEAALLQSQNNNFQALLRSVTFSHDEHDHE